MDKDKLRQIKEKSKPVYEDTIRMMLESFSENETLEKLLDLMDSGLQPQELREKVTELVKSCKFTSEQQRHYAKSNYNFTLGLFKEILAQLLKVPTDKTYSADFVYAASRMNQLYYAMHREIKVSGLHSETFGTENSFVVLTDEMVPILMEYAQYHEKSGLQSYTLSINNFFDLPEQAQNQEKITEISQDEYFNLPLAKAWNLQAKIADEGSNGFDLNVGGKSLARQTYITATISNADGGKIEIDDLDKGVQRAIGNLIHEAINQNKTRLTPAGSLVPPIAITKYQIYRAFARLPNDATVTEQQAAEIESSVDKMLIAPSKLNFKAQLEKHKNIHQQNDYDYTSSTAGYQSGTLITGSKKGLQAHDGTWVEGYVIYEYPMFYKYSHLVGQIAKVPNTLLTGPQKSAQKNTKVPQAKGTARNIAVRENILSRIYRMTHQAEKKHSFVNVIKTEDVASDCGIELTSRSERTLRKNIGLYLEELLTAHKIKKYAEHKTGRKVDGYQISI